MKLFHSPASPFVRKIMVLLAETGHEGALDLIPASGTTVEPGTLPLAHNPLGKIPCLTREDGTALYDSRVITRYLDDHFGAGLYPPAPRLWETLVLEATADGILDAGILMVYEARVRPEDKQFAPWVEGQWTRIARTLDAVEARWLSHLAGPLDMGQIALGCALGYLDFRHAPRSWQDGRPGLAAWAQTFAARPAMVSSLPH